jgi:hypothetical protein
MSFTEFLQLHGMGISITMVASVAYAIIALICLRSVFK